VLKSFAQSRGFIFIDPEELRAAKSWLIKHQRVDGSFPTMGRILNKDLQVGLCLGGVEMKGTALAFSNSNSSPVAWWIPRYSWFDQIALRLLWLRCLCLCVLWSTGRDPWEDLTYSLRGSSSPGDWDNHRGKQPNRPLDHGHSSALSFTAFHVTVLLTSSGEKDPIKMFHFAWSALLQQMQGCRNGFMMSVG